MAQLLLFRTDPLPMTEVVVVFSLTIPACGNLSAVQERRRHADVPDCENQRYPPMEPM